MRIARPVLLNHILSPYGVAAFSTLVFLISWVFPPALYTALIGEPDLIFLDPGTLLFFMLCIAGFWAGLLLFDFLFPSPPLLEIALSTPRLKGLPLILPLLITTAMTVLVVVQMFEKSPNILVLLADQQGESIKSQQAQQVVYGPLGWAAIMQVGVLWWTYWMLSNTRQIVPRHRRDRRIISWFVFTIGLLVQIALCFLKVSRADLLPVIAGLAVLYMMGKIRRGEIGFAGLLRYFLFLSLGAIAFFSLFSVLRGSNDPFSGIASFVGYTVASYNRLTAVLNGTMHYPYGGHGIYLSTFLDYNNAFNTLFPLRSMFGWPEYLDLWHSEFIAPEIAGLKSELIWSGTFGYLFSDFGWTTPLILVGYGIVYGLGWRLVKFNSTVGLTVYPWLTACALCWFSANMVFDFKAPFFIVVGLLLAGYERLLSIRIFGSHAN